VHFIAETASNGVVERTFTLGDITGVLWTPATGSHRAPLVLLGHGGGQHKRAPGVVARAQRFAADGFAAAAIDMPGHGDRPRTAEDEQQVAAIRQGRAAGVPLGPIITAYNADLAARAVPDWQATMDALRDIAGLGSEGQIGYCGLAMGTAIGVPLVAAESRITAAVFGVIGAETLIDAARAVTVPIEFLLQWDDELVERESGLALFDAFGSSEKTLHANSGGHVDVPRFELDSSARFFARHLSRVRAQG
jgi:dienelactone hydrolase